MNRKDETIKETILRERGEAKKPLFSPIMFECNKCKLRKCVCNLITGRVTTNWSFTEYRGDEKLPCGYTARYIADNVNGSLLDTENY